MNIKGGDEMNRMICLEWYKKYCIKWNASNRMHITRCIWLDMDRDVEQNQHEWNNKLWTDCTGKNP